VKSWGAILVLLVGAALAGEDPAVVEARTSEVVELIVLADAPAVVQSKLDDFVRDTTAALPADTPPEVIDAVVGRIRSSVDSGRVLATVGMRMNARFSREQIAAASAALRAGKATDKGADKRDAEVGAALTQELDLAVARALASASAAVLGQVGDEMQQAVDENEATIERLQREIEAAKAKREAPGPAGKDAP